MSRLSLRWRWCKLTAWTLIPDILQDFQCIFKGDVDTSSDAVLGGVVIMGMMSSGSRDAKSSRYVYLYSSFQGNANFWSMHRQEQEL